MDFIYSKFFLVISILLIQLISNGGSETICENRDIKCGLRCYNLFTQSCINDKIVCPSGNRACGIQCYNPLVQACHEGGITGGLVCNIAEKACGYKCFDPLSQTCHSQRTVCSIGQQACGFRCFDSSVSCTTK